MRALSFIALFVIAAMARGADQKPYYDLKDGPVLFEKFIKDYNRHYKDEADRQAHYEAFLKSLEVINKANNEQPLATFDINNFSDYTPEEIKNLHGMVDPTNE